MKIKAAVFMQVFKNQNVIYDLGLCGPKIQCANCQNIRFEFFSEADFLDNVHANIPLFFNGLFVS